jgi:hypothetical protein
MPVTRYTCPGCTAVVKTANPLAAGKQIKCPRCAKIFAAVASESATARPAARTATAKETKLAAGAKEAKIAAPQTKTTQLAAGAAKETKIAAAQVKTTQLAAGAAKETKIAAQAKTTKLATAQVKETKLPSARSKQTKLAPPAAQRPAPATTVSANGGAPPAPFLITCPSCRATAPWKATSPPPIGKRIKCPRCAASYVVPAPQAKSFPSATAKPATTAVAAPSKVPEGRSLIRYACPGCKAVLKTATPLPAGKAIKCPRCQRTFAISGKKPLPSPTKPPAPRTQSARDTKLLLPPPQVPAKATTLAAPAVKPGDVKRRVGRMPCPACKAVLKFVGVPPIDKPLKCPKCGKTFQVRVKKKTAKPTQRSSVPAGQKMPTRAAPKASPTGIRPKKAAAAPATSRPAAPAPSMAPVPAARPRRRLSWFIGLVVLALLSVGLYTWLGGYWTREIPDSAWVEFTPPDGRCRVLMPGLPDAEAAAVNVPGLVSAQKFTVSREEGGASFLLTCSEHAASVTGKESFDDLYGPLRDYILGKVQGSLRQERDIALGGERGREFQVALTKGGLMVGRVYLIRGQPHDRLYILVAGGRYFQPGQGDAAKFFNSFKLDSAAGPIHLREKRGRIRTADGRDLFQLWVG